VKKKGKKGRTITNQTEGGGGGGGEPVKKPRHKKKGEKEGKTQHKKKAIKPKMEKPFDGQYSVAVILTD
jgi:hypothetical protein